MYQIQMLKVCAIFFFFFLFCDIDNYYWYCDRPICNDLVVYCIGIAYDVSLSLMKDNKVDSHLNGLMYLYYYYHIPVFCYCQ